jgi:hypothetical protein
MANQKSDKTEETGLVDDDLLGQAAAVGKTTLDMGKKTGKLVFNIARRGLTKLHEKSQEMAGKVSAHEERLQGKTADELKQIIKSDAPIEKKMAAKKLIDNN